MGQSDDEIAHKLGTTKNAIILARKRNKIKSRTAALLTAREVARRLGLGCSKTVTPWIWKKYLYGKQGQQRGGAGRQWYITEKHLLEFLENPAYWHLWEPERIPDPALRQWTLNLRQGISFVTASEVAEQKHTSLRNVSSWIRKGYLSAVKRGYNWYIREDDLQKFVLPKIGYPARTRHFPNA